MAGSSRRAPKVRIRTWPNQVNLLPTPTEWPGAVLKNYSMWTGSRGGTATFEARVEGSSDRSLVSKLEDGPLSGTPGEFGKLSETVADGLVTIEHKNRYDDEWVVAHFGVITEVNYQSRGGIETTHYTSTIAPEVFGYPLMYKLQPTYKELDPDIENPNSADRIRMPVGGHLENPVKFFENVLYSDKECFRSFDDLVFNPIENGEAIPNRSIYYGRDIEFLELIFFMGERQFTREIKEKNNCGSLFFDANRLSKEVVRKEIKIIENAIDAVGNGRWWPIARYLDYWTLFDVVNYIYSTGFNKYLIDFRPSYDDPPEYMVGDWVGNTFEKWAFDRSIIRGLKIPLGTHAFDAMDMVLSQFGLKWALIPRQPKESEYSFGDETIRKPEPKLGLYIFDPSDTSIGGGGTFGSVDLKHNAYQDDLDTSESVVSDYHFRYNFFENYSDRVVSVNDYPVREYTIPLFPAWEEDESVLATGGTSLFSKTNDGFPQNENQANQWRRFVSDVCIKHNVDYAIDYIVQANEAVIFNDSQLSESFDYYLYPFLTFTGQSARPWCEVIAHSAKPRPMLSVDKDDMPIGTHGGYYIEYYDPTKSSFVPLTKLKGGSDITVLDHEIGVYWDAEEISSHLVSLFKEKLDSIGDTYENPMVLARAICLRITCSVEHRHEENVHWIDRGGDPQNILNFTLDPPPRAPGRSFPITRVMDNRDRYKLQERFVDTTNSLHTRFWEHEHARERDDTDRSHEMLRRIKGATDKGMFEGHATIFGIDENPLRYFCHFIERFFPRFVYMGFNPFVTGVEADVQQQKLILNLEVFRR